MLVVVALVSFGMALLALALTSPRTGLIALAGAVAMATVALVAWRPMAGCALLAVAVPLTAGLGRDTVIPLLRVSEALTALVGAGVILHLLAARARRPYTSLDVAVLAFTGCGIGVPLLVALMGGLRLDLDILRNILAPAQYLAIYLIFSRVIRTEASLSWLLRLALLVSAVVAVIGIAQLADLPGVRDFLATFYLRQGPSGGICQYGVCRPTSLVEHWSSFGAYSVMNYVLALALLTHRVPSLPTTVLAPILMLNAIGALISQTQAAIFGLAIATVVVMLSGRRIPKGFWYALVGMGLGLAFFLPQLQARVQQQLSSGSGSGAATPESLQTRERYWTELFIPAIEDHAWLGTATVIPASVPDRLAKYVDSEYLRMAFRAGALGIGFLLAMLAVLAVSAFLCRGSPSALWQAVGTTGLTFALIFAVMGISAEYTTYAGVAQPLWMTIGLVGAARIAIRSGSRFAAEASPA